MVSEIGRGRCHATIGQKLERELVEIYEMGVLYMENKTSEKTINSAGSAGRFCLVLLIILLNPTLYSQDSSSKDYWKDYSSTGLEIEDPKELRCEIHLREEHSAFSNLEEKIKTKTQLRFMQMGIAMDAPYGFSPYLSVQVQVVGNAFTISTLFYRLTEYRIKEKKFKKMSITWHSIITGTHGNKGSFIIETVDEELDNFFYAFLKANPRD